MAGFETIVRPVVFPNIRPAPTRSLPPADDPNKGMCVIHGSGGQLVDLPFSWSASSSKSRGVETERRVDEVRIYQMEDDGTVNKKNFVDVQVANKITTVEPGYGTPGVGSGTPDVGSGTPGVGSQLSYATRVEYYKRVEAGENIEIRGKDLIKHNPDAPPEFIRGQD